MDRLAEQAANDWEPLPGASQTEAGPSWLDGMPRVELPVIFRTGPTTPAPALRQQLRFLTGDLQWQRLLLVAVPLPVLIVELTEGLLRHAALQKWDLTSGVLVYTLLVGEVALLSTLVGKLIPTWPWRLVIFGWALTLVHLTLLRAAASEQYVGRNPTIQLTLAFVSAELSAISIWGVLGTLHWPARLPVAVMLGSAVVYFFPWPWGGYAEPWVSALKVQVFALLILSAALRAAGYELRRQDDRQSMFPGSKHQFTIAHLFIWTTAIALLLGVLRFVGPSLLWTHEVWQPTFLLGVWRPTFLLGGCFAISGLAAFSAALGSGHWSLRLAVFVGMALAAGLAAALAAQAAAEGLRDTSGRLLGLQWMIWTGLAQCFLASLLLIGNVTGYRLLRTGKPLPIAAWLRGG